MMTRISYHPIQPGIPATLTNDIHYQEVSPVSLDNSIVYKLWTLKTLHPLNQPFDYLVLPDGCIDIVFDVDTPVKTRGALIMTPHTVATRLPIGTSFRYVGIRLYPGAWQFSPVEIVGDTKVLQSLSGINLVTTQERLSSITDTDNLWPVLEDCCRTLHRAGVVQMNPTIAMLLDANVTSATTMASQTGYSIRHIQRVLRRNVGYTPHDFIKVIRFQRALYMRDTSGYADQSHYIREFRRITGMTPQTFYRTYTGMA